MLPPIVPRGCETAFLEKSTGELQAASTRFQVRSCQNRGANASLCVPSGSLVGVLQSCRMESDGPFHQPLKRARS